MSTASSQSTSSSLTEVPQRVLTGGVIRSQVPHITIPYHPRTAKNDVVDALLVATAMPAAAYARGILTKQTKLQERHGLWLRNLDPRIKYSSRSQAAASVWRTELEGRSLETHGISHLCSRFDPDAVDNLVIDLMKDQDDPSRPHEGAIMLAFSEIILNAMAQTDPPVPNPLRFLPAEKTLAELVVRTREVISAPQCLVAFQPSRSEYNDDPEAFDASRLPTYTAIGFKDVIDMQVVSVEANARRAGDRVDALKVEKDSALKLAVETTLPNDASESS
ncbi:hypothetical protein NMY22_g1998 [Coprinellus aureogranulatus]|nr:hypothetical protein NMY22_g1998 [Coprinellus aureogranulatus]